MPDGPVGCAKPTGTVIGEKPKKDNQPKADPTEGLSSMVQVRVGGKAPDFEAPAWHKGKMTTVKLSDYAGKWVMLCFYPGDFTFV